MFIELVDRLVCPHEHERSWLVAAMDEVRDRDIVRGTLGCPVCRAEFPVENGIVRFADVALPPARHADSDDAVRLAAALELTDARLVAVLHGRWGELGPLVRTVSPAQLLLVNAPAQVSHEHGLSLLRAATSPIGPATVDALALDDRDDRAMRVSLLDALRPGGRVLARVAVPVPEGVQEIARDADVWVGEKKGAAPRLVSLGRRA